MRTEICVSFFFFLIFALLPALTFAQVAPPPAGPPPPPVAAGAPDLAPGVPANIASFPIDEIRRRLAPYRDQLNAILVANKYPAQI